MAARLLRDAAKFFLTVAESSEPKKRQMTANASVFRRVADAIEKDPESPPGFGSELTSARAAAKLLEDAAAFFLGVAEQNEPLKEQMEKTADVFRQVGRMTAQDPTGAVEDDAPVARLQTADPPKRNPLTHTAPGLPQPTGVPELKMGVSYPTAGQTNPVVPLPTGSAFQALRSAVIARDHFTCRYCGLVSRRYHEVIGPALGSWDQSRLVTACIFCAQVGMLDRVAKSRSGVLVGMPEVSQTSLNATLRVVYVCRISQGHAADLARQALDAMMARRQDAREQLGTDDPAVLAADLADCPTPTAYETMLTRLRPIRLLPLDRRIIKEGDLEFNQFPQILAFWRSKDGPFGGCVPKQMDLTWLESLTRLLAPAPV